ncbi:lipocalin/fatty-acid binding family protein [Streptomyces sp. NPDC057686]|uniref:lipocalin/fatty-acid binding family protein n=1 Tax=Streptomyces sp. NPDC057686 TaxID=3346212 RepID=UPI0036C0CE20
MSSEGYEQSLQCIGIGPDARQPGASEPQTVTIVQEMEHYALTASVPAKTYTTQFTLVAEYVETSDFFDDRQVKGIVRRDNNRIIQHRRSQPMVVRTLTEEGFEAAFVVGTLVAQRKYRRRP